MSLTFRGFAIAMLMVTALRSTSAEEPTYKLRYQFKSGEAIRWDVEHRSNVRTTVSGTTQTAETLSNSVKLWRVVEVKPDGSATFEHSIERVDMRNNLSGCNEVRYNSKADAKAPVGFEDVAKSVGVVLSVVTIDAQGKILHRERKDGKTPSSVTANTAAPVDGWMTIPLPDEAIPVGYAWSLPLDIDIPLETGGIKRIKAVQRFTLEDVKTGVATIRVTTEILSPVTDPAIESQLVQRECTGRVRFDIDAGRVLGQQMDVDKHVVGFRGDASSIHYVNRFCETLQTGEAAPSVACESEHR